MMITYLDMPTGLTQKVPSCCDIRTVSFVAVVSGDKGVGECTPLPVSHCNQPWCPQLCVGKTWHDNAN